jgi:hypothetical protein
MCLLLAQLEIGFFSSFSAAAVYSTNEANKAGLKQSIIFRCLWICLISSYFGSFIEGSHTTKNMASGLIRSNTMSHNIRLTTLSSEREEERRRLEEKLRQLEDDLGDSTSAASLSQPLIRALTFSASSTPTQSPAKACRRKQEAQAEDEDENLLHEVDEEMKRGQLIYI